MAHIETLGKDFEYRRPEDLKIWQPPRDPSRWNEELLEIGGRDPHGDPRLRLRWGGTAKKNGYVQTPQGSIPCQVIAYPAQMPRVQKLKGFSYFKNGENRFVSRADEVPKGELSLPVYEYLELGILRWVLERKFTLTELILMQMRPDPDSPAGKLYGVRNGRRYIAPLDRRGEYIPIFPLETPDGRYFEPNDLWFQQIRKAQQEVTIGDKSRLLAETLARFEKQEEAEKARDKEVFETLFEETIIEAEKAPQGQVIFT